jgi:polyhydroxybutyrate depolymerase
MRAALLLALLLPACAAAKTPALKSFTLEHGGHKRAYHVYVPENLDKAKKHPLLFFLHGGGGTGSRLSALTAHGFEKLAKKHGAVLVYPDGLEKNWNDYRADQNRKAQRENVDDVAFLTEVADRVLKDFPADPARVYVTGISNGAMMSNTLACLAAGRFAAAAPVAGAVPENLAPRCSPARPVPLLIISGTEDALVHWNGGEVTGPFGKRKFGRTLSVEASRDFWLEKNSCDRAAVKTLNFDNIKSDGTAVKWETYGACAGGAEVQFIGVEGGGHTWPGGAQYLPKAVVGRTSREFSATQEIWSFFMRHSLPAGN